MYYHKVTWDGRDYSIGDYVINIIGDYPVKIKNIIRVEDQIYINECIIEFMSLYKWVH